METITVDGKLYRPATPKELCDLRGIIYAIRNRYDGKCYIGKASRSFNTRYGGSGRWWVKTVNVLLKRTLKLTSYTEFDVFILQSGLTTNCKLNEAERKFTTLLNAYAPNGYNVRECGEEGGYYGREVTAKIEAARAASRKTYTVRRIDTGEIIEITHLRKWCQDNGIREMAFRNMLCSLVVTSQGYCRRQTTAEEIERVKTRRGEIRRIKCIETGEIIKVDNVSKFCRERHLCDSAIMDMLRGRVHESQGFCLPETTPIRITYQITDPKGHKHMFTRMRAFERKHRIRLRGMLTSGIKGRHGWSNLIAFREETTVHATRNTPHSTLAA